MHPPTYLLVINDVPSILPGTKNMVAKEAQKVTSLRSLHSDYKEYSTINKNPETDIGVQPEGQKSKTASYWLLSLP